MRNAVPSLTLLTVFVFCCTVTATPIDDNALYLTPLIKAGRIGEARAACKVNPMKAGIESYSGYLTVDEAHGSNLFFWFFPALINATDAPVLLWLQGGPGSSSLFGVFDEHGPFSVDKNNNLKLRNHTWVTTHSMLYVDNPVGTGYSFTGDEGGYSTSQTAVGLNMYYALVQFFTVFPDYQKNDFFVTGESYGGKYVPSVSYAIHLNNPNANVKINLKGLAIGNGLIDPINQLIYSEYLYQHGFIDENGKRKVEELENQTRNQILNGDFKAASLTLDKLIMKGRYAYRYPTLFQNLTGMEFYYNMLWDHDPLSYGDWKKYVQQESIRNTLHVGKRPLNNGSDVAQHLQDDKTRSMSSWLASLLDSNQYRVLLYSGQLDIIVPYTGTVRLVHSLQWSGVENFKNATRTIWRVQSQDDNTNNVAGYATTSGPLTVLLVRNSGHMVPGDQPILGLDLINRFTAGKPF